MKNSMVAWIFNPYNSKLWLHNSKYIHETSSRAAKFHAQIVRNAEHWVDICERFQFFLSLKNSAKSTGIWVWALINWKLALGLLCPEIQEKTKMLESIPNSKATRQREAWQTPPRSIHIRAPLQLLKAIRSSCQRDKSACSVDALVAPKYSRDEESGSVRNHARTNKWIELIKKQNENKSAKWSIIEPD